MRDISNYQHGYSAVPYERFQIGFRKRKILEILSRFKHDVIIEVGCGLDSIMNEITDFKSLLIVEPGEVFYDRAIADSLKHSKKDSIKIYKDFFESFYPSKEDLPINFILISSLLHEVENVEKILAKAYELASQETIIHINVPNARSFHRLLAVEMGLIRNSFEKSDIQIKFQQQRTFDLTELTHIVKLNGFKVIESGSYSIKPFTHQQMEDLIQSGFITENMLEGFYKMEQYLPGLGSEIFVNLMKEE